MMSTLQGATHSLARTLEVVERVVQRIGVMHRVFGRAKSQESIAKKIGEKGYARGGRLLQDLIGIRVVVYFSEDCSVVQTAIDNSFTVDEQRVDEHGAEQFGPRRLNMVVRADATTWSVEIGDMPIDQTFELQIRTVLSEGWHEVEHDLRYKCKSDWSQFPDKDRTLNGTLGALETAEWAMVSLFEGLAYRHYKNKSWEAMLRHKLRLRVQDGSHLSDEVHKLLSDDAELAKRVWRADRATLLDHLARSRIALPLTFDNLVHLICAVEDVGNVDLARLRSEYVAKRIEADLRARVADPR